MNDAKFSLYTTTNTITTTTTPQEPAVDLRRPITSPVTAALLLTLKSGWATVEELAEEVERLTGRSVSAKDLYPYLHYYQRKGWVTSGSPLWGLTDEGTKFVEKYERWLLKLVGEKNQPTENFASDTKPDERVEYRIRNIDKTRLNQLIEKFRQYLRNKDEEDVLRVLLEHFAATGSTYMYLDELAERLGADASWLYREVLRPMRARRIIYVWKDGKVGLGRVVRRALGLEG